MQSIESLTSPQVYKQDSPLVIQFVPADVLSPPLGAAEGVEPLDVDGDGRVHRDGPEAVVVLRGFPYLTYMEASLFQ